MRPILRLLSGLPFLLLIATAAVAQDAPAPRDLVVNEIFYDPPEEDQEFIELFNRSEKSFDLSGFAFSDANESLVPGAATTQTLAPGGYVVLARDSAAFQAVFPEADFTEPGDWPALNNGGDTVTLYYTANAGAPVVIDAVPYAPSWGGRDNAHSLERIDPAGPSSSAANFGTSTAERGGTPGAPNSLFAPDTAPPRLLFAEAVADAVVEVVFDEPLDPASVTAAAFSSLDGRAPQEATLFEENAGVRLMFGAALAGGRLTVRGLRDPAGNTLEEATVNLAVAPQPGELVVNEILHAPLTDDFDDRPNQPEYVELLNAAGRALSLGSLFWTDAPTERGVADTTRLAAERRAVAPGGFALVYAAGDDADLAGAFPNSDFTDSSTALVPVDRSSLGLLNSGDLLHLQRAGNQSGASITLDSVRYDPAWHAAGLADATGVSLERILPGAPSNEAGNWTSSTAPSGGTPGRPNTASLPPGAPPSSAGLVVEPSPFYPEGDGQTSITYTLDEAASLVRVRIFDSYGRRVRTLERGGLAGRTGQIPWDGLDDDGHRLRVGIYVVLLEALHAERGTTTAFKTPVVIARPMN